MLNEVIIIINFFSEWFSHDARWREDIQAKKRRKLKSNVEEKR